MVYKELSAPSRLLKQIVGYAPNALLPAVLGLASSALFTRLVDSVEYGRYSLVLSVAGFLSAVGVQWINQSLTRFVPAELDEDARAVLRRSIPVALLMWAVVVLGLSITTITAEMQGWLSPELAWIALASLALGVAQSIWVPVSGVFQAQAQVSLYTRYHLLNVAGRFGLSLLFVFTTYRNAAGLVLGAVLASLAIIPFAWHDARIGPLWKALADWRTLLPTVRRLASYGFPMMGWTLIASFLAVGDRYLIQFFLGSAEVGIYSASYSLISGLGSMVSSPVLLATHPFLMKAWGKGDAESAGYWLGRVFDWFTLVGAALVATTWVASEDIAVLLLGPGFREGHAIMPIVLAGVFTWQLAMYLHKPLEFVGKTKLMLGLATIAVAVNTVLNILLLPAFGYIAAAYSTLASYGLYALLTAMAGRAILPWRFRWSWLFTVFAICLGSALFAQLARQHLTGLLGGIGGLLATLAITAAGPLWLAGSLFKNNQTR